MKYKLAKDKNMNSIKEMIEIISSELFRKYLEVSESKPSWLRFSEGYERPSKTEIEETFLPLTTPCVANILGYSDPDYICDLYSGRRLISYQKWRLFLTLTGRVSHMQEHKIDLTVVPEKTIKILHSLQYRKVQETLRPCYHEYHLGYITPTSEEIHEAFSEIDKNTIAEIMGVNRKTVNRYLTGNIEIPYAVWRLFLIETGKIKV